MVKYQRQYGDGPEKAEDANDIPVVDTIPSERKCFGDGFKVLVLGVIIFCAAITIGLVVDIYYLRGKQNVAVVTEAPECTRIATDLLKQNDNAIDATIGALVCLAVVRPDQCSLASGGYLLVHHNGVDQYLDFQFAAPKVTNRQQNTSMVAIPGLLAGLQEASAQYGSLPFSQLVQPSIELASNGFIVANSTALYIEKLPEEIKKKFMINGKVTKAGEKMQMPVLAETLKRLTNGNYSFAEDVAKATNGSITVQDFTQYKDKIVWQKPLVINMRGTKVISTGLPSTGVLLLSALNILNEFNGKDALYEATAEVLRTVLPKKDQLEDPAFDSSQKDLIQQLLNVSMAKHYAGEIKSNTNGTLESKVTSTEELKKKSSATVSVINLKGDAVSAVSSLGDVFGAKLITESGIVLNNGLSMFSKGGKVNKMESYKRPLSYSSPAFILNEKMVNSFAPSADLEGLASIVQVIRNRLISLLNEEKSISYPRLFSDSSKGEVVIEGKRFSKYGLQNVVTSLKSRYQTIRDTESIGTVNVAFNDNFTSAISDPRSKT